MQRLNIIVRSILSLLFGSCQFNKSVNKDLITGAFSQGNGIGCDNVTIQVNGKNNNTNEFTFGEQVNFVFDNVKGLNNKNDKVYPEISMYIVKNEKDTVLSEPNLFKKITDGTNLSPLQLQANFRAAFPNQHKEKYNAHIKIWDKKGDGTFNYELPFTIKKYDVFDIKNNGISYSNIYLWNETLKVPVFETTINSEHLFYVIFDDIEGLEISDTKVFPIFSLELTDANGNKIISNPNLLSPYEEKGVNPEGLKKQLRAKINLAKGAFNNPYKLQLILKDKNSSKEILVSTSLEIQ